MIEEFLKKANILFENKEYEEVLKLIKNYPKNNHPSILYYSALINDKLKKKEKALKILNQLIENHPNFLEPFHLSANISEDLKKYDESEKILKEIIKKNSNDWKAIYNLARIKLHRNDNKEEALKEYKKALELNPKNYQILRAIAQIQLDTGLIDLAEETINKILLINNNNQYALNLLTLCYLNQLKLNEAEKISKKIIEYKKYNIEENIAHRNLILIQIYKDDYNQDLLLLKIKEFLTVFGNKEKITNKIEFKKKNKKIKIGFVSSDFRKHSINNVIHSLFLYKNKKKFEFCCYSSTNNEDKITDWYKKISNSWKNIIYLNDKKVSELIISDNIDILIFIGGLTGTNRYLLSTYKSAKKQISFHPASPSGIKELDYWITDSVLNPINIKEKISEKVIRMEHLFNFTKPENNYLPKINEPPMKKNNFISFSSFSNPMKLSLKSLELWLEVLKNFQGSKLYLKFFNFLDNRKIQNTIYNFLEKNSIQKERIIFINKKFKKTYLEYYNDIDIALDTFPYSGATTSFGAICMGVPVYTLTGKNYISRQSASVLTSAGLSDWIVHDKNDYIKTLKKLANLKKVSKLRLNLRKQVAESPLCNGVKFAKNFEDALEKIFYE